MWRYLLRKLDIIPETCGLATLEHEFFWPAWEEGREEMG